jgi:hypothetical protein
MVKLWFALVLTIVMGVASFPATSQQPASPGASSQPNAQDNLPPGTKAQGELASAIDVKKAHGGDQFRARLWKDVRISDKLTLPQKTILVGHVVNAQPRTSATPESRLTLAFDKAILKNGTEIPFHGIVAGVELSALAAAAAQNTNADLNTLRNPGSTTNYAMPGGGAQSQQDQMPTLGPTGVLDPHIILKIDAAGNLTILNSATRADIKIKDHSTLDIVITHIGD